MTDVTHIPSAIEHGDLRAADQLLALVYEELRKLAARMLAREKPGQTLEATALVLALGCSVFRPVPPGDYGSSPLPGCGETWSARPLRNPDPAVVRWYFPGILAAFLSLRRIVLQGGTRAQGLRRGGLNA